MNLERYSQSLGQRPALILVDMINGFTDPVSPLGTECDEVVEAIQILLKQFRVNNWPIFFTTVVYDNDDQARVFRNRLPALDILQKRSHWADIDPRLVRHDHEILIEKHWASAFFGTQLSTLLQDKGVDSLIVTGLTTSGCVRATAVDGLQYDYPVFVPRDAVADRNHSAHQANLHDLHAKYADVVDLKTLLTQLKKIDNLGQSGD